MDVNVAIGVMVKKKTIVKGCGRKIRPWPIDFL